jgi:hypothetical protein
VENSRLFTRVFFALNVCWNGTNLLVLVLRFLWRTHKNHKKAFASSVIYTLHKERERVLSVFVKMYVHTHKIINHQKRSVFPPPPPPLKKKYLCVSLLVISTQKGQRKINFSKPPKTQRFSTPRKNCREFQCFAQACNALPKLRKTLVL